MSLLWAAAEMTDAERLYSKHYNLNALIIINFHKIKKNMQIFQIIFNRQKKKCFSSQSSEILDGT